MSETPQQAYISKVHLKGYKSIKDLEIDFKPGLNIIIGPNGSGKTNFLEFVKMICSRFHGNQSFELILFESVIDFINFEQDKVSRDIITKFKIVNSNYNFIIEEKSTLNQRKIEKEILIFSELGVYIGAETELFVSREENLGYKILKPDIDYIGYGVPNWYDEKQKTSLQMSIRRYHDRDGWHLYGRDFYAIFGLINLHHKFEKIEEYIYYIFDLFESFKELLEKFSPIKDIKFNSSKFQLTEINENEYKLDNVTLSFYVNGRWNYWQNLSDGTKRIFYIIATIYTANPISTIFLEEPELGIHPDQLHKLMDFLKEQSKEKQIIITTHSPEVLSILGNDELDRIIVTRYDAEKGTQMHHLSPKQIRKGQIYIEEVGNLSSFWLHSNLEEYEAEEQ